MQLKTYTFIKKDRVLNWGPLCNHCTWGGGCRGRCSAPNSRWPSRSPRWRPAPPRRVRPNRSNFSSWFDLQTSAFALPQSEPTLFACLLLRTAWCGKIEGDIFWIFKFKPGSHLNIWKVVFYFILKLVAHLYLQNWQFFRVFKVTWSSSMLWLLYLSTLLVVLLLKIVCTFQYLNQILWLYYQIPNYLVFEL